MIFFDPENLSFLDSRVHVIPMRALEVSESLRDDILLGISATRSLQAGQDGLPTLVDIAPDLQLDIKSCSPAQGLVALFAIKQITEDHVLEAIAQISDPVQQYTARIGYQRATTWERGSPTMLAMAQLLQLSDEDLDNLFSYAVTVQV